jgi:hypothetical protein
MTLLYIIITLIFLILLFSLFMSWRRRTYEKTIREMKMSGKTLILGPEPASFRGATAQYGKLKNDGVIALFTEQIIFKPLIGEQIIIPINEVKEVDNKRTFLGSRRAGLDFLILRGTNADIGFYVKDTIRWQNAIKNVMKH